MTLEFEKKVYDLNGTKAVGLSNEWVKGIMRKHGKRLETVIITILPDDSLNIRPNF